MIVLFTCYACKLDKMACHVELREPLQAIEDWLEHVGQRVAACHGLLSPDCKERKMNLMIPKPKDGQLVGEEKA
jgi:hypothetical protein